METHSSILAGKIPWTEEPGGLQSIGLQRVGHDSVCPCIAEEFGVERSLLKFEFDGLTCFLNNRGQPNFCSDRGYRHSSQGWPFPRRIPEGFHRMN